MVFWLIDHLTGLTGEDTLYIALMDTIDSQFGLVQRMRTEYPHLHIKPVLLTFETRGAAETLYTVLQSMTAAELSRKTISLDCDTIYFEPILERFRALESAISGCFFFEDKGGRAIYSYLRFDEEGDDDMRVVEVREKVMISSHANTGAYAFADGRQLHSFCAHLLDHAVGSAGEYYTTNVIREMLQEGLYVRGLRVSNSGFVCVGTPSQLTDLLRQLKLTTPIKSLQSKVQPAAHNRASLAGGGSSSHGALPPSSSSSSPPSLGSRRKMRFCFDLDNTLVSYPHLRRDYASVEPIMHNIQLVRELKAAGHYIIIQTARRMKTHEGNVGKVISDVGLVTLQTLARFAIPYDELLFGKPYADVYVDDLAVHSLIDTAKEIGWALNNGEESKAKENKAKGFVAARHFNSVEEMENVIIKSAATSSIQGEIFFYTHIPDDIADLFPRLHRVDVNTVEYPAASPGVASNDRDGDEAEGKMEGLTRPVSSRSSLTIEKIKGVTFSHLYVNRAMTGGRLLKLMEAVRRIHRSNGLRNSGGAAPDAVVDVYANYAEKISKRYSEHSELYQSLDVDAAAKEGEGYSQLPSSLVMLQHLVNELTEYQQEQRAQPVLLIHGDPVFSNALLTSEGRVVLIDMRGSVGTVLTTKGDLLYDLAKIYQSLDGYDFILHDKAMDNVDEQHREEYKRLFAAFVQEHYPSVSMRDVHVLTASLYFSLIPLHNNFYHQTRFLQRARTLLSRSFQWEQHCPSPSQRISISHATRHKGAPIHLLTKAFKQLSPRPISSKAKTIDFEEKQQMDW